MKIRRDFGYFVLAASLLLVPSLLVVQSLGSSTLKGSVSQDTTTCSKTGCTIKVQIYVTNKAAWAARGGGPSRDVVPNNFGVSSIDFDETTTGGTPVQSFTFNVAYTLALPNAPPRLEAVWDITSDFRADRWNPFVLPGETVAVLYFAFGCSPCVTLTIGVHNVSVTVHGTYQGMSVSIPTSYSFTVVP